HPVPPPAHPVPMVERHNTTECGMSNRRRGTTQRGESASFHPQPWRPRRRLPAVLARSLPDGLSCGGTRRRPPALEQGVEEGELGKVGEPLLASPDETLVWRGQH